MAEQDDYLVDMLVDLGLVNAEQVAKTRAEAQASNVGVVDLMLANKLIRPADITQAKAAQFGAEVIQLAGIKIPDEVISIIPRNIAKKFRVIPVFKTDGKVAIAIADPSDLNTIDTLTHLLNAEIELRVASEPDIETALGRYYGGDKKGIVEDARFKDVIQELTEENVECPSCPARDDGGAVDADAPLIRLVNQIIVDAFKLRASDIHLEPLSKKFRLRYRVDGVMQEMKSPPKRLQSAIITRLKIQSNMSISEHRIPQDGRIQSKVGSKLIDLRVSCLPTNHGESIVMRILDKEGLKLGLPELGIFHGRPAIVPTDHQPARRHLARHRPDGFRQDHDAVFLSALHQPAGPQNHHRRRPGGIYSGRDQPGAGERDGGADVRHGPALDPPPGAEHRDDRGKFATWKPRASPSTRRSPAIWFFPRAHQRRPERRHAPHGHRGETLFGRLVHALSHGATACAQGLQKMRAAVSAHGRGDARPESHAGNVANATLQKGRGCNDCSNTGSADALASLKSSSLTTRRGN